MNITITGANGTREGNREIRRAARAAVNRIGQLVRTSSGAVRAGSVTVTGRAGMSYTITRITPWAHPVGFGWTPARYRMIASWGPTKTVTASDAYKVSGTWAATVAPTAAAWAAID